MNTIYCDPNSALFALDRGKMPKLLPIEQARLRHERRQAYEAIIMKNGEPHYVITVEDKYLSVTFLDDCGRCYLEYDFQEKQRHRLFLTHATHREFIGESDDVSSCKMFAFEMSGRVSMGEYDEIASTLVESETQHSVAENWDVYPQFGDYASLCREERV